MVGLFSLLLTTSQLDNSVYAISRSVNEPCGLRHVDFKGPEGNSLGFADHMSLLFDSAIVA